MFVIEQPIPLAPAADSAANELKSMFEKQAGVKRFDLIQTFHAGKQEEDLTIGLILNDLTKDFARFVRNYNMHNIEKTTGELHAMLIEYEKGLPKKAETPQVMAIRGGKIQKTNKKSLKAKGKGKANGKGKDKQVYIPKPKNPKPTAKENHSKDDTCHHYKEVDHWKRNCPFYLAELLKKKKQVGTTSSSGIFTIELFSFPNKSWVGNDVRAQVEAIGSFDLVLPNGLVICLDNCHYAPIITRGVVSVHRLVKNGFVQLFTNCGISVSKKDVLYFNDIPTNGIYEIDMHDLVPNVNSIYNKRIENLQQEGILKSTDDESLDQCVSCISGKMTRKSFSHRPERATDLLGIIYTDVCGPLRHVSRQVCKNEVENQLEKTIKALRSDRGGEYIIQEFKDYLKACGIVQQLTPPYAPQHNGVSERRNHTLLEMVRSMMNLTTLSLSFWDYAIESATRILNMVPTKKVDKTPYELWYGKVPNLSYLKVWGCEALAKRDTPDKLQQRSVKCIFIRYPKEIIDKDTSPSEITSEILIEVEGFEPPQEEEILIRRSKRSPAMLDPESNKWLDAMNAKMQSMIDNSVWVLIDLPPNCKTVGIRCTRPDVAFAQNITSCFQQNPGEPYWTAVKNIFKYLRNTKDMSLVYVGNPEAELRVDCYCNAGFETDRDDIKYWT
ncbi:retrovirus-related pol polyprotein from transposon TNT 1-94 [Tanacetum coccineum]